jgi:hypothetical protein
MALPARFLSTLTVTRTAAGQFIDGDWIDGSTSTITVPASVQPMTEREIRRLPEAIRTTASLKVYSDSQLRPADEHAGTKGDTFAWDGYTWVVVGSERQAYTSLEHYKSYAALVDLPEDAP